MAKFFLPLLIFFISSSLFYSQAEAKIFSTASFLSALPILQDGPDLDACGYGNCDMTSNGETAVIAAIPAKGIVFDVGANRGEWRLQVIEHQPLVHLHCFEPVSALQLELNKKLKGYHVVINALALSHSIGWGTFSYYPKNTALSTLHRRVEVEKLLDLEPQFIQVKLEKLDHYCQIKRIKQIDFLKIDTEGHEYSVLRGAENLLKKQQISIIQFEYGGTYLDSKSSLKEVYVYLTSFNYKIYRITGIGLIEIPAWRDELENYHYSNYLAVKN